ncbi:15246_t:CDS:1, partial [Funneliformis caledonium]
LLREIENLGLDEDDLKIIRKKKINSHVFLKTSKEDFERYGLEAGSAITG